MNSQEKDMLPLRFDDTTIEAPVSAADSGSASQPGVESPAKPAPPANASAETAAETAAVSAPAQPAPGTGTMPRVFGVGGTGAAVVAQLLADHFPTDRMAVMDNDAAVLETSPAAHKMMLSEIGRGLVSSASSPPLSGGEMNRVREMCRGRDVVLVVAGLGGRVGSEAAPMVVRAAKDTGATVFAFATLPFECEGTLREKKAAEALKQLHRVADAVICLPNQKVFNLIDPKASMDVAVKVPQNLMSEGIGGFIRLLAGTGQWAAGLENVRDLLQCGGDECAFASVTSSGPDRVDDVVRKLMAHPLMESGSALTRARTVIVGLAAGELSMFEFDAVVKSIRTLAPNVSVHVGASTAADLGERFCLTAFAVPHRKPSSPNATSGPVPELTGHLMPEPPVGRDIPLFTAPPADIPGTEKDRLHEGNGGRRRKGSSRLRQTQLALDIISKGRFDKTEPTLYKGEDLDVPTYARRGIVFN
jgi:cell division protein FtsZ